jgi:predicted DNA-binding ArsR family transcriptional regulator
LRDAQFLSWKTFKKTEAKMGKESNISAVSDEMAKKANEIAEKIRTSSAGSSPSKEELSKLLPELLYLAFVLAENYGASLEELFMQTVDEYILGLVS